MTKKKLSRRTKSHLQEILEVNQALTSDQTEIDRGAASGHAKLLEFLESLPPWAGWYSYSQELILTLFLEILGLREKFLEIAKVENKQEAKMDLFREISGQIEGGELFVALDDMVSEDRSAVFSLLYALTGNMNGIKQFNQSVSELVSNATENHEALFTAVAVDRSVVANPIISKEISQAQIRDDAPFMDRLAKSITQTKPRRDYKLDDTRFMLEILDEVEGLDQVSNEQIAEFLQNDLAIYPSAGKDPESAIKKLLQRRKIQKGT